MTSRPDLATGSLLAAIVGYEAAAYLTGRPKLTDVCRRRPLLAHVLAGAWLLHVFIYAREVAAEVARELESDDGKHAGRDAGNAAADGAQAERAAAARLFL